MTIDVYVALMLGMGILFSMVTIVKSFGLGGKALLSGSVPRTSTLKTYFYAFMSVVMMVLGSNHAVLEGLFGEVDHAQFMETYELTTSVGWEYSVGLLSFPLLFLAIGLLLNIVVKNGAARRGQNNNESRIGGVHTSTWNKMVTEGDRLVNQWTQMSTSLDNVLTYPLLANFSEPIVGDVIKAVSRVRAERPDAPPGGTEDPWETSYGVAVRDLREKLITVQQQAKMAAKNYDPVERKKLDQARNLLAIAYDSGATPAERTSAYSRVRSIMDELSIHISDEAEERLAIETASLRVLEA